MKITSCETICKIFICVTSVEVCDASDDDSSNVVGYPVVIILKE